MANETRQKAKDLDKRLLSMLDGYHQVTESNSRAVSELNAYSEQMEVVAEAAMSALGQALLGLEGCGPFGIVREDDWHVKRGKGSREAIKALLTTPFACAERLDGFLLAPSGKLKVPAGTDRVLFIGLDRSESQKLEVVGRDGSAKAVPIGDRTTWLSVDGGVIRPQGGGAWSP